MNPNQRDITVTQKTMWMCAVSVGNLLKYVFNKMVGIKAQTTPVPLVKTCNHSYKYVSEMSVYLWYICN